MATHNTCRTCQWFEPAPLDPTQGLCHAEPKKVSLIGMDASNRPQVVCFWPQPKASDWCGKWTKKNLVDMAEAGSA